MGTLIAAYVRKTPATLSAMRSQYGHVLVEDDMPFVGVEFESFEMPTDELQGLSKRHKCDVIWLVFQSAADAFEFYRWDAGKLCRALAYGCHQQERTWEHVEGSPEPWERKVFFSRKKLAAAIKHLETDAEKAEVQRIFREQQIAPGQVQPSLESREAARGVATFYQLPGWPKSYRIKGPTGTITID